jgi:hypothetical protein
MLQSVGRIDVPLYLAIGLPTDRPWKVLGVVPFGRSCGDKQLRHFLLVEVTVDCGIGRGAERGSDQQHAVFLDQLAHLLDRLRRRIAIVIGDEIDLTAVNAPLVVYHPVIRGH